MIKDENQQKNNEHQQHHRYHVAVIDHLPRTEADAAQQRERKDHLEQQHHY